MKCIQRTPGETKVCFKQCYYHYESRVAPWITSNTRKEVLSMIPSQAGTCVGISALYKNCVLNNVLSNLSYQVVIPDAKCSLSVCLNAAASDVNKTSVEQPKYTNSHQYSYYSLSCEKLQFLLIFLHQRISHLISNFTMSSWVNW